MKKLTGLIALVVTPLLMGFPAGGLPYLLLMGLILLGGIEALFGIGGILVQFILTFFVQSGLTAFELSIGV